MNTINYTTLQFIWNTIQSVNLIQPIIADLVL